jgi:flagellar motor switch protein FliN
MKERTLTDAAARELASMIGALLGTSVTATVATASVAARWVIRLTFGGPLTGTLTVGFGEEAGRAIAQLVTGLDEAPPDAAVTDTLLEVCSQGIATLGQRDEFRGLRLANTELVDTAPEAEPVTFDFAIGDRVTCAIGLWDESVIAAVRTESSERGIGLGEGLPPNLDVILDIELPLSVRFGQTEMTLQALTQIGPGSVIDLGRSPEDPVDVLVHGRLVARGEVVVISGNYGVRITDLISTADRLRTVAG